MEKILQKLRSNVKVRNAASNTKKKTKEEKYKEWDNESAYDRTRRILAEGRGPQKVGSDPDEARWYAERKKGAASAAVAKGVLESAAAQLDKKSVDMGKRMREAAKNAQNQSLSKDVRRQHESTFKKLDEEQKRVDRKVTGLYDVLEKGDMSGYAHDNKWWNDRVLQLDMLQAKANAPQNSTTMTPEKPGQEQPKMITAQDAAMAGKLTEAWNVEETAARRMQELTGKKTLTGEEKEELAGLGSQWGYTAQAHGGLDGWLRAIEDGKREQTQIAQGYKEQQAGRDMSLVEAADANTAQKQLDQWGTDEENIRRMRELEGKDSLTVEEEGELIDLKRQYAELEAYAQDKGGLEAVVEAEKADAQKTLDGSFDIRQERMDRIEGKLPDYETEMAVYNGFEAGEYEAALEQQNFENDMLMKLYQARNMGMQATPKGMMDKPVNINKMIAQLEQSTLERQEKFQQDYDNWKTRTVQGIADNESQIAYWNNERRKAEAANDGAAIKAIDKRIEELKQDSIARNDAILQMNPDFAQNAQPRMEFAAEDPNYWLINWDAMTDMDPTMNPYGYRGDETKEQLYERLLAMDASYDPKMFYLLGYEKDTYNYKYFYDRMNGTDTAGEYLKRIDNRLTKRMHDYNAKRAYELGKQSPSMALVANVLLMPLDMMGIAQTNLNAMIGRDTNPYGGAFAPFVARTMGTQGGADVYERDIDKGVYNLIKGMSEVGTAFLMGPAGKYLMPAAAGTAQAYDTLKRGGSSFEGALEGDVASALEWFTEGTFDRITDMIKMGKATGQTWEQVARKVLGDFVGEYAEEIPGNLATTLFDRWLMGADSAWEQEKKETGKSNKEMWDQLLQDMNAESTMAGLTGVALGGIGYASSKRQASKIAGDIMDKMPDVPEELAKSVAEQMVGIKEAIPEEMEQFATLAEESQALAEVSDPFQAPALVKGMETQTGQLPVTDVTGIDRIQGEKAYVTLQNGQTVDLDSVTFDDLDTRDAYRAAVKQPDVEAARAFLSSWQESGLPVSVFERAFNDAFDQGRRMDGSYGPSALNQTARRTAYQAGQKFQKNVEAVLDTPKEVAGAIQDRIAAMPRTLEEGFRGGVVMATRSARLNPSQAVQAALLDEYGKRHGVSYVVVDTIKGGKANGLYKDGVIYVAADAVEGNLTRGATHEGWHYLKESLGAEHKGIKAMENLVLSVLQKEKGYSLETRLEQVKNAYKEEFDQDLDDDAALEEIVADSLFDVFSTKENLEALIKTDGTVAEKFVSWVKRFRKQMRETMRRIRMRSPEARAMFDSEREWGKMGISIADNIIESYNILMKEAKEKRANLEARKANQEGRYSLQNFGFEALNKESRNNIKMRNGLIVTTREELIKHIDAVDGNDDKVSLYLGAVSEETKEKIEKETGKSLFKKGQYSFCITYDDIRHIKKHFSSAEQTADIIERLYAMLKDHDSIKTSKNNRNGDRIFLRKNFIDMMIDSADDLSRSRRAVDLVTIYIVKMNIKKESQSNLIDPSNVHGAPVQGSTLINIIPEAEEKGNGKYSYAGEYARTANVARLADAQRMEKEGKTTSEIYRQTGWYKGMDGMWRFEIDDSQATLRPVKVTDKTRLANIMDHEQLFDAYPALANLKVMFSDTMTGSVNASYVGDKIYLNRDNYTGMTAEEQAEYRALRKSDQYEEFNRRWWEIDESDLDDDAKDVQFEELEEWWLNTRDGKRMAELREKAKENRDTLRTDAALKKTLLHEIQHAIQNMEGFETGANQIYWRNRQLGGYTAKRNRNTVARLERELRDLFNKQSGDVQELMRKRNRLLLDMQEAERQAYFSEDGTEADVEKARDLLEELADINEDIEKLAPDLTWEYDSLRDKLRKAQRENPEMTALELYEYTAGEIEARDVSDRANMTESQRMEKMPKLDENAVFKSRYSLQNTRAENLDEALMENAELKKSLETMRRLFAENREEIVNDPKAIRQVAKQLIDQTQSQYSEALLSKNLRDIYNGLSNARWDNDYQKAMQDMVDLSKAVIEKSVRMDNNLAEEYADLRKELRTTNISLTESQIAEAAKLYGSYEDFRRQYMGRLRLTKPENGIDLTSKWQELSEQYPEFFPADTNEGDMISRLADVVEALKPTYSNIYGQNMGEAAYDLAMDMWQGFLEVPQLQSEGDKRAAKMIDKLEEVRKKLREVQYEYRALSKSYTKQITKRREREAILQAKGEIARITNSLSKQLLKPTNKQHVPERLRGPVEQLLLALDFRTRRTGPKVTQLLEDLHMQYLAAWQETKRTEEDEGYTFDEDIADLLKQAAVITNGGDKPLVKMSLEELQSIRDVLRVMRSMVTTANALFVSEKKMTAAEAGAKTINTLNSWKSKNSSRFAVIRAAGDMLQRGLIKPVYFFEQLKGTPIYDAWINIRKGEAQHTRQMQQAEIYLQQTMWATGYNPKEWKLDEELRFDDEWRMMEKAKGKEPKRPQLVLTKGELMMLYATAKRENITGTKHLEKGGVVFESQRYAQKDKNASFQIWPGMAITLAEANLTKEQLQYVDRLVEYLSTVCSAQGNVASRAMYDIDKFKERYYVPFKTAENYLKSDPSAGQDSRLSSGGFTKALTEKAKTPLTIKDFTQVWCEHVEKMSAYAAFALPLEDFNRIYNSKGAFIEEPPADQSVKASIAYALGERGKGYIDVFLKDLNGNNRNPLGSATMLNALTSKAKGVSIGFNLSVAVQQMSAAPRAMAMIDAKYMAAGMVKGLNYKKSFEELKKWAPIALQKEWGYFDTNMARSLYDRMDQGWRKKLDDAAGWLPQQGDRINWAQMWEAVKLETADKTDYAPGTEEFFKAAGERITDVIDHTQVADSVFQRAEWARSKDGLTKALVSFMSEPITQYNMLWDAANKFARAKGMEKGAARTQLINSGRKAVRAVATSMILNSALQALAAALRDRENEKKVKDEDGNTVTVGVRTYGDKWTDAFIDNMISAPLSMLPFVSDAVSMIEGFDPSRMDMQVLSKLVKAGTYWWDVLSGKKELDAWKGIYTVADAISYVTGVPVSNLMRDGYAAYQTGYEALTADLLPGTAWDKAQGIDARLKAAEANYTAKKGDGDARKLDSGIYYDLLLKAWYEGGAESEEFKAVLDAMTKQGVKGQTIYTNLKKRLSETEPLVSEGANALAANDLDAYEKAYTALMEKGYTMNMALEMIKSAAPKEEAAALNPADELEAVMGKLRGGEKKTGAAATAYGYGDLISALESGNTKNRDVVLNAFEEAGVKESTIRSQVTGEYRKRWLEAENGGDKDEANRIKKLLKESGLDYDDEDFENWWTDDAYDRLYEQIDAGEMSDAQKTRQSIVTRTKDDSASWSRITSYYSKKYKDLYKRDYNGAMRLKSKLIQLGMYESTIAKWERQAKKTK